MRGLAILYGLPGAILAITQAHERLPVILAWLVSALVINLCCGVWYQWGRQDGRRAEEIRVLRERVAREE